MPRRASPCWCANRPSARGWRTWWRAPDWPKPKSRRPRRAQSAHRVGQPQPWYVDRAWFQAARGRTGRDGARVPPREPAAARHRQARICAPADAARPPFLLDALLADAQEIVVEGETVRLRGHTGGAQRGRGAGARGHRARVRTGGAGGARGGARCWPNRASSRRGRARCWRFCCARSGWCASTTSWCFTTPPSRSCGRCWRRANRARFSVATFKEWTGVSRKYAIPLLEYLDRERITRREGDERLIL